MKTIKVSEATGPALDWLVAVCEGHKPIFTRHWVTPSHPEDPRRVCIPAPCWVQPFDPSTDWAQGGPILEREKIEIRHHHVCVAGIWYRDGIGSDECMHKAIGPTPLIAAMRCYCISKLGETAEVSDELLESTK